MAPEYRPGPPPRQAADYIARKGLRTGWDYREVWREEHAHAFTVANMMSESLLIDVRDSLDAALKEGKPFAAWKKEWAAELSKRGWWGRIDPPDPDDPEAVARADLYISRRLATIWRVNTRQAYQAGVWERGQRSTSHPYLLYRIGPSKEHREQHVEWDGLLLPKDDAFWSVANPSNGWGCKCTSRFVSQRQYERYRDSGIPGVKNGGAAQTKAPNLHPKQYRNKVTGKTHTGYRGIDPASNATPESAAASSSASSTRSRTIGSRKTRYRRVLSACLAQWSTR